MCYGVSLCAVTCYDVLWHVVACCVVLCDDEFSQCLLTLLKNGSFTPLVLKVLLQLCVVGSQPPSEDATK